MGSVSAGRAAALSARRSDGCQSAKRRGSHTAAASTNSRRHQAPGASHTVRLSAQIGHLRERRRQMNRCLAATLFMHSVQSRDVQYVFYNQELAASHGRYQLNNQ